MSEKSRDIKNRWRSKTVGFRVSPEEWAHFERIVALTGVAKQDYLIKSILERKIIVNGNPRVSKALRDELQAVLTELVRIENGQAIDVELLDLIKFMSVIIDGLHNNEKITRYVFKE